VQVNKSVSRRVIGSIATDSSDDNVSGGGGMFHDVSLARGGDVLPYESNKQRIVGVRVAALRDIPGSGARSSGRVNRIYGESAVVGESGGVGKGLRGRNGREFRNATLQSSARLNGREFQTGRVEVDGDGDARR